MIPFYTDNTRSILLSSLPVKTDGDTNRKVIAGAAIMLKLWLTVKIYKIIKEINFNLIIKDYNISYNDGTKLNMFNMLTTAIRVTYTFMSA